MIRASGGTAAIRASGGTAAVRVDLGAIAADRPAVRRRLDARS